MNPSARRWETAWKVPIGRPNCSRVLAYDAVSASAPSVTPSCSAAAHTVSSSWSRPASAPRSSAGASVKVMSAAWSPSLVRWACRSIPAEAGSTR